MDILELLFINKCLKPTVLVLLSIWPDSDFLTGSPIRDTSMREKLLRNLVMDKSRAYVTVNIRLTAGNGTNMSGLAAVNHT